jgi:hypothetical protein
VADVFRLTRAILAVTFSPEGRGSLSTLPVDAQISLIGRSSMAGLVDVNCDDKLYCIFEVDLMARSVILQTMAAATEPTRSAFSSPSLGAPAHSRRPRASFRRPFANSQVSARPPG